MSETPDNRGRRGPAGITGQTGQTGQPGQPGVPGVAGDIGETGLQGQPGETGNEGKSPTGELLEAVRTLVAEVEALSERLSRDYPNRDEVKAQGRKRAFKTFAFGVIIIVFANLLTLETVSYCFLNPAGTVRSNCNYIPGYQNTVETGNVRLKKFNLLLKQIVTNENSILDLQRRMARLEQKKTP